MDQAWEVHTPGGARESAPKFDVLTPSYYKPVQVYILADKVWERLFHFDTELMRPVVCSRQQSCRYCPDSPVRPTGYVAAALPDGGRLVILQLSDAALLQWDALVEKEEGTVRGLKVETRRKDRRRNSKMSVSRLGRFPGADLPEAFDVRPTLEMMWGCAAALGARPRRSSATNSHQQMRRRGRGQQP